MLLRLEDAGIIGSGHETLHQRFSLAINEEDLVERGHYTSVGVWGLMGKTWTSGDHAPALWLGIYWEDLCQRGWPEDLYHQRKTWTSGEVKIFQKSIP